MDKFVEKFNIFDLFTILIPGIIISGLLGISLLFRYHDAWTSFGNEKYILFFIFSYLCGVIFHEIGIHTDKWFMFYFLYGGNPREMFLLNNEENKIFDSNLARQNALLIKKYLNQYIGSHKKHIKNIKKYNSLIFSYCLNVCEMNGIIGKAEKMTVNSEMSRSLFWGCIATFFLNLIMIFYFSCHSIFLYIELPLLITAALIFLFRKSRYEKYKYRVLVRIFLIHSINENKVKD